MVNFKVITKAGEETISFPSSYKELTLKQFIELRKGKNRVENILEILSTPSVPAEVWSNQSEDLDVKIAPVINWLITDDKVDLEELEVPEEITIKGKTIKVPSDLGYKTFGQKSLVDEKFKSLFKRSINKIDPKAKPSFKMVDDPVNIMPYVLATYFQPYFNEDEKFVEEEIELIEEAVLSVPFVEAYPVANFFLKKSTASVSFGRTDITPGNRKARRSAAKTKSGRE